MAAGSKARLARRTRRRARAWRVALASVAERAWPSRPSLSLGARSVALCRPERIVAGTPGCRCGDSLDREHINPYRCQACRGEEDACDGGVGRAARLCDSNL